jgi:hypothetical protein
MRNVAIMPKKRRATEAYDKYLEYGERDHFLKDLICPLILRGQNMDR